LLEGLPGKHGEAAISAKAWRLFRPCRCQFAGARWQNQDGAQEKVGERVPE
jgi:hypothetical protein